jgi:hypothetical protein
MGMAFYSLDEWADILRGDFNHFRRGQSHWLPWQLDISCVPQPTGTTGPVTRVPVPGAPDVQAPKPAAPKEAPHLRIPRFFRIP